MARRNEGASPRGAVTEAQRSQRVFCAKTPWAAVRLSATFVGSALKARCGDSRASPPRLRPKSLAAEPLGFLKHTLKHRGNLTRTRRPRLQAARQSFQSRADSTENDTLNAKKENPKSRFAALDSAHFGQRPSRFASDTIPDNQRPANVAHRYGSHAALQPSLGSIEPPVFASSLAIVSPLPSAFVRLRSLSCFLAAFPARNPKSKVPKPVEHCQCGAQREQGEQYIDRRRRAVQWTERFAPKSAPHYELHRNMARLRLPLLAFPCIGQF
jgi:hypothetical protein